MSSLKSESLASSVQESPALNRRGREGAMKRRRLLPHNRTSTAFDTHCVRQGAKASRAVDRWDIFAALQVT